jgi:Ice-binding-like
MDGIIAGTLYGISGAASACLCPLVSPVCPILQRERNAPERVMAHYVTPWSETEPTGASQRPHRRIRAGGLLVASLVTAALASTAQAATVPLATADSFAVLAGSTVTNTGPSVISGDLGVNPGTAVTGFPPGTVTAGTIHAADAVASKAKGDLVTAYNDAAGRSSTATISADLAGRTLTPGVYTSASSLGLSGDLTLDAQGDPNAVFVFQAGSTLTAGSASRVLLIGGAQPCNVIWQVGSSATIGTSSAFAGNILALTSISMTTGATLNGRALARNGAVTLDTNTITRSACAAGTTGAPGSGGTTGAPGSGGTTGAPGDSSTTGGGGPGVPTARLTGPRRCVEGPFRARVSGRKIAQVTFFVDGKRRQAVKATRGRTVFPVRVNPLVQGFAVHRITAKVHFVAGSGAKARTLRLVYQRCSVAGAGVTPPPRFTG